MIRIVPGLIGLSLLLPAAAIAQTPMPAPQAAPLPVRPMAHAGTTLPAYQAKLRDRMMRLDTNHDGRIDPREFAARAAGRNGPAHDPQRAFAHYDLNHDGFIEPGEIDAMAAKRFARLDADHDGVVSRGEHAARHGGGMPADR